MRKIWGAYLEEERPIATDFVLPFQMSVCSMLSNIVGLPLPIFTIYLQVLKT